MASFGRDPEHFSPPSLPSLLSLPLPVAIAQSLPQAGDGLSTFSSYRGRKHSQGGHLAGLPCLHNLWWQSSCTWPRAAKPSHKASQGSWCEGISVGTAAAYWEPGKETVHQASLGIRRMSNKQFLRLTFRNHAFILSLVMVLDQELQGREKLLVNWECCQENITSSVSIRSLQMSQFTKKPLLATWSLELSASQWWQCVKSLLL